MEAVKTHKLFMMVSTRTMLEDSYHNNDPDHLADPKEEEVGGQCSGGEGEEAVAKKFVQIISFKRV